MLYKIQNNLQEDQIMYLHASLTQEVHPHRTGKNTLQDKSKGACVANNAKNNDNITDNHANKWNVVECKDLSQLLLVFQTPVVKGCIMNYL